MLRTDLQAHSVNLAELRAEMTGRVGTALAVLGVLVIVISWPLTALAEPASVAVALGLLAVGWGARSLATYRPTRARHFLTWALLAGILAGMWGSPAPWLPFLGLAPLFVGALLVAGADIVVALAVMTLATGLTFTGYRDYPLPALALTLAFGVLLAWQTVRALFLALDWATNSQHRAQESLAIARNRQAELAMLSRSLEQSVAALKRTQGELIAARRVADEARRAKDEFVAKIGHELRTPLNVITGFSEIMHLTPEVYALDPWPPGLRRDVAQVHRNSRYLLEMIDDILSLSSFEIVEFGLNRQPTDLAPLLVDSAEYGRTLFAGKPVDVFYAGPPALPPLAVDRTRLRQVLINLLNNAQRFTDQGHVRIDATVTSSEVVVSVADTGAGIPSDQLPHVFEEFYQGDRTLYGRRGGAGLGLAICKQFVEAHGGRIWVESTPGAGATFGFALPLLAATPAAEADPANLHSPSSGAPAVVLVADADAALAAALQRRLPSTSIVPLSAPVTDAGELAAALELHQPQVLVANGAPGALTGATRLAGLPASVAVVTCALPGSGQVAQALGAQGWLPKPVSSAALHGHLRRLCPGRDHLDVLVVDDNRSFCLLLERMLTTGELRCTVRTAYDGAGARAAVAERVPDVMLLDLDLGSEDGRAVLAELRTQVAGQPLPVLLVTAGSAAGGEGVGDAALTVWRAGGLAAPEGLACVQAVIGALTACR